MTSCFKTEANWTRITSASPTRGKILSNAKPKGKLSQGDVENMVQQWKSKDVV